jgi:Ca-activated chloride channel family protein
MQVKALDVLRVLLSMAFGLALILLVAAFAGVLGAPEWANAGYWWLLIPVLLLPLQRSLTGRNVLAVPGLDALRGRYTLRMAFAWLPQTLLLVSLGLMVLALARPQIVERSVTRTGEGLDIILAIDTSCSMEAQDLSTSTSSVSRLGVAKGVVSAFVDGRPHDRIGVVVFGEEAFTHVPLTLDHKTLNSVLTQVQLGVAGPRGTAIGSAIAVGARRLKQIDNPSRIMVLLTDGQNNAGQISPIQAAEAAAALGIRIYTVGIGSSGRGGLLGFLGGADGLDEETLKSIAEESQGEYFRARSAQSLQEIFETIDTLEKSEAEVTERTRPHDWYRWVLLPAFVGLLLHLLLATSWLRRWP